MLSINVHRQFFQKIIPEMRFFGRHFRAKCASIGFQIFVVGEHLVIGWMIVAVAEKGGARDDDSSVTPAARHLPSPGKAWMRCKPSPYPSTVHPIEFYHLLYFSLYALVLPFALSSVRVISFASTHGSSRTTFAPCLFAHAATSPVSQLASSIT